MPVSAFLDCDLFSHIGLRLGSFREHAVRPSHLRTLRLPTWHRLCQPQLLWDALQEVVAHRDGLQRMPLPVGIGVATFFNDLQRSEIDEAVELLAAGGFR